MSVDLHRAIRDAMQAARGYREKAILVSQVLEATGPVAGHGSDVYSAVHDLFSAMPARLVHGSVFLVTTQDVEDGIELAWDAREEPRPGYERGQGLLAAYEPDEPIARALAALERVCDMRAGHVRTTYEEVANSSSFPRSPYLRRRVVAHIPLTREAADARMREREAERDAPAPTVSVAQRALGREVGPAKERRGGPCASRTAGPVLGPPRPRGIRGRVSRAVRARVPDRHVP